MIGWRQLGAFVQISTAEKSLSHSAGNGSLAHLSHKAFTHPGYSVGSIRFMTSYLTPGSSLSLSLCDCII